VRADSCRGVDFFEGNDIPFFLIEHWRVVLAHSGTFASMRNFNKMEKIIEFAKRTIWNYELESIECNTYLCAHWAYGMFKMPPTPKFTY